MSIFGPSRRHKQKSYGMNDGSIKGTGHPHPKRRRKYPHRRKKAAR